MAQISRFIPGVSLADLWGADDTVLAAYAGEARREVEARAEWGSLEHLVANVYDRLGELCHLVHAAHFKGDHDLWKRSPRPGQPDPDRETISPREWARRRIGKA